MISSQTSLSLRLILGIAPRVRLGWSPRPQASDLTDQRHRHRRQLKTMQRVRPSVRLSVCQLDGATTTLDHSAAAAVALQARAKLFD